MSASTGLDLEEQIARIHRTNAEMEVRLAETGRMNAETRKLLAEQIKLTAEGDKLTAEGRKYDRDPWLIVLAGLLGVAAAVIARLPEILTALRVGH
jgi:hypothetical protein